MSRYETLASKTQDEIRDMLSAENYVHRPWQLVDYSVEINTLKIPMDEIEVLYKTPAYLRPGFHVENGTVYIPNLFIKWSGDHSAVLEIFKEESTSKEQRVIYQSMDEINGKEHRLYHNIKTKIEDVLNDEGLLDKEKLYKSDIYKYLYVRKSYQDIIVDKINFILKNKACIFKENVDTRNDDKIINTLLHIDRRLISLFHHFDFQYEVPSVIIYDEEHKPFSDQNAYILALLHFLGLDIIIISPVSNVNVENIINEELFTVYDPQSVENKGSNEELTKETDRPKKRKTILWAATIILLFGFFSYVAFNSSNEESVKSATNNAGNSTSFMQVLGGKTLKPITIEYSDKDVYEGETLNGKRHGHGTMNFKKGYKYVGEWQNDGIHGVGTMYFPSNGNRYEGEWVNNEMRGEGTMYFGAGDKYVGQWKGNKREGKGIHYFIDGSVYEGEWKDDRMHGKAIFTFDKGSYKGEFSNNMINGKGVLTYKGCIYEGEFTDLWLNGLGKITYSDGERYEGELVRYRREGLGTYYFSDGTKYIGEFKHDEFTGRGKLIDQQGNVTAEGEWIDGTLQN
ncbi:MAG: YceG family protein [Bacillota bacterium]